MFQTIPIGGVFRQFLRSLLTFSRRFQTISGFKRFQKRFQNTLTKISDDFDGGDSRRFRQILLVAPKILTNILWWNRLEPSLETIEISTKIVWNFIRQNCISILNSNEGWATSMRKWFSQLINTNGVTMSNHHDRYEISENELTKRYFSTQRSSYYKTAWSKRLGQK